MAAGGGGQPLELQAWQPGGGGGSLWSEHAPVQGRQQAGSQAHASGQCDSVALALHGMWRPRPGASTGARGPCLADAALWRSMNQVVPRSLLHCDRAVRRKQSSNKIARVRLGRGSHDVSRAFVQCVRLRVVAVMFVATCRMRLSYG